MKPEKGLRFKHSRVLNWDKTAATYEVTRVAQGQVYYRPVYDEGIAGSERLGKAERCSLTYWPRIVIALASI